MTYEDIGKEEKAVVVKDQSVIKAETKPPRKPLAYEGKEQKSPFNAPTQSSNQTSTFQQPFETRQRVDVAHQSRIIQKGIQGTQNLAETAGEAIVHSVTGSQEETEESQRAKRQISDIAETIDASATHGIAADHIRSLRHEANRYIAADMFFDNNGSTYNKVANYYNDHGFTCGISKTYDAVAKNPDRFYKGDGTLNFDEEKIIAYVKSHEKYAESDLNHENPLKIENKKFRKKEEKMQAYVRINEIEADMRQHLEIFNREERELLKPENNNRMFDFRSVKDVNRAESMINKIIIQDVRDLKLSGLDFEDKAIFRGQFDLNKLNRMSSKETKALIDNLQKLLVNPDLDDIKRIGIQSLLKKLDGRMLLTCTSEKLRKLNLRSAGHGVFRLMGGDELASSDVGQGLRQTQQVYRVGKFVATAGVHGVALTGKATHKAAKMIAPEAVNLVDQQAKAIIEAPKKAVKAAGESVKRTKQVQQISERMKKFQDAKNRLKNKILNSKAGKAAKVAGKVGGKAGRVVSAPFKATSKATTFVQKKIITPALIAGVGLCAVFVLMILVGGMLSASDNSGSVILSEEEQFKDYQTKYDSCDEQFQAQVSSIINGKAQTSNLRGQSIPYGINVPGISINGLSIPAEYKNGVTLNYYYDGSQIAGISSNIEDCLSAMAVLMQQEQSEHHAEALELLEAIYKSTHNYTTSESALYPCTAGCVDELYYCNQYKGQTAEDGTVGAAYWSTDMRYKPWTYQKLIKPQEWQSKYNPGQECAVCRFIEGNSYENYAGCTVVGTCYHGDGGDMGRTKDPNCANYKAVYECPGHEHTDNDGSYTEYCDSELGCEGYWECEGHDHYGCPDGHHTPVCYGHVDLTMSVNIASLNRIYDMGGVEVKGEKDLPESSEAQEGGSN